MSLIDDLRLRLDTEGEEGRRLAAILSDQRAPAAVLDAILTPPSPRSRSRDDVEQNRRIGGWRPASMPRLGGCHELSHFRVARDRGFVLAGLLGTAQSSAQSAYITNQASNNVSVIDTATNTVTATITVSSGGPNRVAVSPDGSKVYVTNSNSPQKHRHRVGDRHRVGGVE